MSDLPLDLQPERPEDAEAVERLHARAFGPGRFARTAYRIREQQAHDPALSFAARVGSLLVGSVRMTHVRVGGSEGFLLGPLTVDPAFESRGIGRALIERASAAAEAQGAGFVLLVGDLRYYEKSGFRRVPPGSIRFPGPVDPARILCRSFGAAAPATGEVTGAA